MWCSKCGAQIDDSAAFCGECGARTGGSDRPAGDGAQRAAKRKSKAKRRLIRRLKRVLPLAAAGVLLIVLGIALLPKLGGGGVKANYFIVFDGEDSTVYNGKMDQLGVVNADDLDFAGYTLDGKQALMITANDGAYDLKHVSADGVKRVCDSADYYELAVDSGAVLYRENTLEPEGPLRLYRDGQTSVVYRDALFEFCISPDGETLMYTANFDRDDGSYETFIRSGSRDAERLGKNMRPLAVSDGGKYIYYTYEGEKTGLYVRKGNEDVKLLSDTGRSCWLVLNADLSQAAFGDGERSYLSVKGGEKQRLSGGGSIQPSFERQNGSLYLGGAISASIYGVPSFLDCLWSDSNDVYYVDSKLEAVRIAKDVWRTDTTPDGSKFAYVNDDGDIYYGDVNERFADKAASLVGKDAVNVLLSDDGRILYFVDEDDALYAIKRNGKRIDRIANDVSRVVLMPGTHDCYFIMDSRGDSGTLMLSRNGGGKQRITGGGETSSIIQSINGLCAGVDPDGYYCDLYRINGKELERVQDSVMNVWSMVW